MASFIVGEEIDLLLDLLFDLLFFVVLPKYEVKVTVPPVITILDEEVEVTVCGK